MRSLLLLATGVILFAGQRPALNKESADAQFLVLVDLVTNYNRKLVLLEQFVEMFPTSPARPWALAELSSCYRQDGNLDKMVLFAERAIAADPNDLETAHQTWKALGTKPGADKWSTITVQIARKIGATPAPAGEPTVEWKERAALAAQIVAAAGPGEFETILAISDPKQRMQRLEEEMKRPPPDADRPKLLSALFRAARDAGEAARALDVAELLIKDKLGTAESLLFAASEYFRASRDPAVTLDYAKQALALVQSNSVTSATPVDAANVSKLPQTTSNPAARANFLVGGALSRLEKYRDSDQSLRAALEMVGDDLELKGQVLLTLGSVNVKLGKLDDAIRFYQSCSVIESPFRDEAKKTMASIKTNKPAAQ
jgi:tetratricopeptide (TPR) repeat protein